MKAGRTERLSDLAQTKSGGPKFCAVNSVAVHEDSGGSCFEFSFLKNGKVCTARQGIGNTDMASDEQFVRYVLDQLTGVHGLTSRRMFGEYAIYKDGKVVALICDNQLFVKPTSAGRQFIGTPVEAPAYKGAKPSFLIDGELDNKDWLSRLILLTHDELPLPKPKKNKELSRRSRST